MEMNWAERITDAWEQARGGVIVVGELIAAAQEQMAQAEFEFMLDNHLPFPAQVAHRLVRVAQAKKLEKPASLQLRLVWSSGDTVVRSVSKSDLEQRDEDDAHKKQLANLKGAWRAAAPGVRQMFLSWVRYKRDSDMEIDWR